MIERIKVFFFSMLLSSMSFATLYQGMSDFEIQAVDQALQKFGLQPEASPEGKRIKEIFIFTIEPFSKDAGILALLDRLHISTKEKIIKRYLFFKKGDVFSKDKIIDSELYLRRFDSLRSLAVIVPVQTTGHQAKDGVDILVVTRDLMSLRPDFDFSASGDVITSLAFGLGEYNLFGLNKRISAEYNYKQAYHLLSAKYFDPQVLGSRWQLSINPSLILARKTLGYDGFLGKIDLKRALLSRSEKWGFGIDASLGSKPVIDFSGANIRTFKSIERRYRYNFAQGSAQIRRSFGTEKKTEIFGGYGFNLKQPLLAKDMNLSEKAKEQFQKHVMPKHEFESFFTLGASFFFERFLTLYDFNNYKLQEIKRLGPSLSLSSEFSPKKITFGDYNFLKPELKLGYTWSFIADSFLSTSFYTSNRFDGKWNDNTIKYALSFASPKIFALGRVVFDGLVAGYYNNRDNQKFVLGSESGNRGIESRFYLGSQALRANLEFRSSPLELWIVHAGAVFFYDVGGAFETWKKANPTHTLGFGLRLLAPQISAEPFRIDIGFPIYGSGTLHHTVVPSVGVGQAF